MKTRSYKARILSAALSLLMGMTMLPDIGVQTYAYDVGTVIPETDYLTFTAGTNATIAVKTSSGTFQYQTKAEGAESYSGWSENSSATSIDLNEGDSVRFKGSDVKFNYSNHVSVTGSVACSGDVCSLRLDNEGKFSGLVDSCFAYMFYGCTGLTTAPELSATQLARFCYQDMFYDCTSLTTAPALPATELKPYCYSAMFYECTSLTTAPALSATQLADECYQDMFYNCDGLTTAPALPAKALAEACYAGMFYDCDGLTTAPALPATELADGCYQYMFYNCDGLTTAPELPATELKTYCYLKMFYDCDGLTTAPALPATELKPYCYQNMFYNCDGLTTAPALPATVLAEGCYQYMFYNCTGLTEAPALPATTLADYCCVQMFSGCTGIKFSETLTDDCKDEYCITASTNGLGDPLYNMFYGTTGYFANDGTPTVNTTYYMKKSQNSAAAITGVSLNKTDAQTIAVDESVAFTATVSPDDATDKTVKWSTSSDSVKLYTDAECTTEVGTDATSTLTVYAKGISAGNATVTAASNADATKTASCSVTVENPTPTYYDQTWTLTMDSYEYDGTAHTPTINGKTHGEVEYTYYNTDTGKVLSAAPSEPGNYKVEVFAEGGMTHYTRTQRATYSILEAVSENGQANPASFKDNGVIPKSDGKLFAGWFTDSARTTAYTGETDKAYAKFIDEKILTVKAQISSNTTADSEKTSIRFITSLDSLKYQNVGFKIKFNGQTVDQKLTKVYSAINAGGAKVKPSAFSEESQYMGAFALNGIPNNAFDKEFTVTPYYTTLDGTVVEGETKTFMIADMIH